MSMDAADREALKREIRRELLADLVRLLGEDPPGAPVPAPQPGPTYPPPPPWPVTAGCSACRLSGVCNCVMPSLRQVTFTAAPIATTNANAPSWYSTRTLATGEGPTG